LGDRIDVVGARGVVSVSELVDHVGSLWLQPVGVRSGR
jgi:hypothetical protein